MEDEQKPESQLPAFFNIGRETHAFFSHWACLLRGAAPFLVLSRFGMKSGAGELLPRPLGEGWGGGIFYSLPGWGRVRVGRGPEGDFGVSVFWGRWFG